MGMKDCKFAIRSGAHASHASRSNIQDGVVIWLRKLNDIGISEDRSFVSVGPGATHGELYAKLDPLELTTVSGRDSAVGLGGLTLGGWWPEYSYNGFDMGLYLAQEASHFCPLNTVIHATTC